LRERGGVRIRTEDFFYREDGRFQKSSLLEIWRGGGEEKNFFLGAKDFFTGRGGGEGGPGKKTRCPRSFFSLSPRASLFPQRHRDWVSRLTEETPGGLGREKKAAWAPGLFSGVGRGEGKVKKGMHGTWIATGERVLSQTQITWSASSKRRGGEGGRQGFQPTHTINNTGLI
jgi:hypothetical protein